jgi:DNA-binding GntR family transcriptional regulator
MFERPQSVRQAAYHQLRQAILNLELRPSQRISEPALAESLGISRTPVREALQRLAQEGLVELTPSRGARVRVISPREVEEVYQVRAILEAEAAQRAALTASATQIQQLAAILHQLEALDPAAQSEQVRLDMAFHAGCVAAAGNGVLAQVFDGLHIRLALIRHYSLDLSKAPDHWKILHSLQTRQPQQAAQAAREHVLHFMEVVLHRLAQEQA